jgi:hypothetical protein
MRGGSPWAVRDWERMWKMTEVDYVLMYGWIMNCDFCSLVICVMFIYYFAVMGTLLRWCFLELQVDGIKRTGFVPLLKFLDVESCLSKKAGPTFPRHSPLSFPVTDVIPNAL